MLEVKNVCHFQNTLMNLQTNRCQLSGFEPKLGQFKDPFLTYPPKIGVIKKMHCSLVSASMYGNTAAGGRNILYYIHVVTPNVVPMKIMK